jgi:hypothetical protein
MLNEFPIVIIEFPLYDRSSRYLFVLNLVRIKKTRSDGFQNDASRYYFISVILRPAGRCV